MSEGDGSTVITGADNIEAFRMLAIRSALGLEVKGLTRHGRSARAIAAEILGLDKPGKRPNAATVYRAFDKYLAAKYPGRIDSRPLDGKRA